ncbi:MAG TPA: class I SAM-dependent methyltransferase [Caulobacteraceae bacterium]|jgi:SAM-dependent methyltransferase|nr:class I SAM-dependent methyltransferase [Caulobacteraceae bacterium]
MAEQIARSFGRQAFGHDPANYDAARPAYPEWVFEELRACGLGPGAAVFEIGAGTGTATRRLTGFGASVIAIEPDARMAEFLREGSPTVEVRNETFEDADLPEAAFDLGLAATSFHWLDEAAALAKIARLLKPGGWWAALWNVFGDDSKPDPFHEATNDLLNAYKSPSAGQGGVPVALDGDPRIAAIDRTGAFEAVRHRISHWPLILDPDQVVRLYASYSEHAARPNGDHVLAELRRIAVEQFGGRVTRNMTTVLYTARRRG